MGSIVWSHTYVADEVLTASLLEQTKSDITSQVNGNIEVSNLAPAFILDASKVDDNSDNAATMAAVTSPGAPGSESLATTLEGELQRLRYIIGRLIWGANSGETAIIADQGGALEWYERAPSILSRPKNLLQNSSFEVWSPTTLTVPNGWSATGTAAAAYTHEQNAAADGLGRGFRLKITGNAVTANTGITLTILADALRPSTRYMFYGMAWATAGDTARITASTGGGTDLDIETTSTTPKLMQGSFVTTAGPANVTLQLVAKAATDIVWFDHVAVFPVVSTTPETGYVAVLQQMESAGATAISDTNVLGSLGAALIGNTWNDATTTLDRAVKCPGAGYMIKVTARLNGDINTANDATGNYRLFQSVDGGVNWTMVDGTTQRFVQGTPGDMWNVPLTYVNTNPTPGVEYRYRVTASITDPTAGLPTIRCQSNGLGKSFLLIEMMPVGA